MPSDPNIPLRIAASANAASGIRLFELRAPGGPALPEFSAGSHLSLRVPNGLIRKYSLCNDPAERDRYLIAVKREPMGGRGGSESMIRDVRAGSELAVSAPANNFALVKSSAGYLFVAGGIGITPIMAMIRQLKAAGGRFKLCYCTRSLA